MTAYKKLARRGNRALGTVQWGIGRRVRTKKLLDERSHPSTQQPHLSRNFLIYEDIIKKLLNCKSFVRPITMMFE